MEIQQDRYENMQPIPAPEPYTLPVTIRMSRSNSLGLFVLWLLIAVIPVSALVTSDPWVNPVNWVVNFLFVAGMGLLLLGPVILYEIRLTEGPLIENRLLDGLHHRKTRIVAAEDQLNFLQANLD
jgi:hypothetical protein